MLVEIRQHVFHMQLPQHELSRKNQAITIRRFEGKKLNWQRESTNENIAPSTKKKTFFLHEYPCFFVEWLFIEVTIGKLLLQNTTIN